MADEELALQRAFAARRGRASASVLRSIVPGAGGDPGADLVDEGGVEEEGGVARHVGGAVGVAEPASVSPGRSAVVTATYHPANAPDKLAMYRREWPGFQDGLGGHGLPSLWDRLRRALYGDKSERFVDDEARSPPTTRCVNILVTDDGVWYYAMELLHGRADTV